jgi:Flp pilus assembly protein TadD
MSEKRSYSLGPFTVIPFSYRRENIQRFHEILELNPDDTCTLCDLACHLDRYGRRDEAIEELRRAIERRPEEGALHGMLGAMLTEAGRIEEAIDEELQAIRFGWDGPHSRLRLGDLLNQVGRRNAARLEWEQALRLALLHQEQVARSGWPWWARVLVNISSPARAARTRLARHPHE